MSELETLLGTSEATLFLKMFIPGAETLLMNLNLSGCEFGSFELLGLLYLNISNPSELISSSFVSVSLFPLGVANSPSLSFFSVFYLSFLTKLISDVLLSASLCSSWRSVIS